MTKKLFQTLSIIALSLTFCLFFIPLSLANDCTNGSCIPDPPGCTDGPCIPPIPECSNGGCLPETPSCSNGDCGPITGCTRSPGYWKTHEQDETWDALDDEYYLILWTNGSAGPYYILAHQYIAAGLNMLNGASMYNEEVQAAYSEAGVWLAKWPPKLMLSASFEYRERIIDLAVILDDYNNGFEGPPACSDD